MVKKIEFLYFFLWFVVICFLWSRMFYFDGTYYWAGWQAIWGDWTTHIPYALNFAYRPFPLPYHPQFVGEAFRYHFAADMISGFLMKIGIPLHLAFVIPSIVCMEALIIVLYYFFLAMFKNKRIAVISSLIFLFNGGFGIFYFLYALATQGTSFLSSFPLSMLTKNDEWGLRWMNFFLAEFIPQRAFLLGAPITIYILTVCWKIFHSGIQKISNKALLCMGVLSGMLPIIHYHSFYVVLLVTVYICILSVVRNHKIVTKWIWVMAPLLGISSYIIFSVFHGQSTGSIRFQLGSIGPAKIVPLIWFWIINLGPMSVLLPLAFFKSQKHIRIFYVPFLFLFVISNILVFQKDPWDNRKFLVYWYLLSAGLVGNFLTNLIGTKRTLLAFTLFYLAIVSGFIDFANMFQFEKQKFKMLSFSDMEFGQLVRSKTDANAVFLTAPTNTYFGVTGGRQIVMGWDVWLKNYGHKTQERMKDIQKIYTADISAGEILKKYAIDYVVIGPQERTFARLNEKYFYGQFPILIRNDTYTIYDVRGVNEKDPIPQTSE